MKPVNPKANQSWILTGRTEADSLDAEAEAPIFWPPDAKSWLIWKDAEAGKDWRREEMGTTEDEMVGWHHRLSGHEFEWTRGVGDEQGSLVYCSPWGRKESDTTERLNRSELIVFKVLIYVPTFSAKFVFSPSLPLSHTQRVSQRLRKNKTHMLVYEEKEKRDKHWDRKLKDNGDTGNEKGWGTGKRHQ